MEAESPAKHVSIIAEIGVNHNGSIELAERLIREAKASGADAVKFQTFKAESLAHRSTPKVPYQLATSSPAESHFDMLKKLELPREAYARLLECCKDEKIRFCSTPYSQNDAQFLRSIGVSLIKVASADIVDRDLHEYLANEPCDIILSSGMATLDEIGAAVDIYRAEGKVTSLTLLQCTSSYPCPLDKANLSIIRTLSERFHIPIGFSDHTEGIYAALGAVALGAVVVEKHFTLDRSMAGPDHKASITPSGLRELVAGVRAMELALGSPIKKVESVEQEMRIISRKSIVAAHDLPAATVVQYEDLTFLRPGTGTSPMIYPRFLGRKTKRQIAAGEQISEVDLEVR